MSEVYEKKQLILDKALNLVPFDGWNDTVLKKAVAEAGFEPVEADIYFPGGIVTLVDFFCESFDNKMIEALEELDLTSMRIRERIATAVKTRLSLYEPHKLVIRKTVQFYALPWNVANGMETLMRTVSHMWYMAGDKATDVNYYTKRFLLSGVYSSTLLYWLDDESEQYQDSWAFLHRRIEDVLQIGNVRKKVEECISRVTELTG